MIGWEEVNGIWSGGSVWADERCDAGALWAC